MFSVLFPHLQLHIIAHIRNKFKSNYNKRFNLVTLHSIVLVGLREWENPPKNCDLLYVYDDSEIETLKNNPLVDIRDVLRLKLENQTQSEKLSEEVDNIQFTNDIEEEKIIQTNASNTSEFEMEINDEINIDDI